MSSWNRPLHVRAGSQPASWLKTHDFRFLVRSDDTGGSCSAMVIVPLPGSGPGPHVHEEAEEAFYVLDGELTFRVGDEAYEATTGDLVHVPRGMVHSSTVGTRPVRYFALLTPGGDEKRLQEATAPEPS